MAKIPFRELDGLLLLDKPSDVSSNQALQRSRFIYRAKKAGHTGTLDPFATGLLPICFGQANKYARWLLDANKTYQFTAVLGQHSTTGDTEGEITLIDDNIQINDAQLAATQQAFLGTITQIPPKYSAIKIAGQRAYELARKGQAVDIPSRQVTIYDLSLTIKDNLLIGSAKVSKGTYIRTLVEDIAQHLNTVAYCKQLRRLQVGELVSHDASLPRQMHTLETIQQLAEAARDDLLLPIDLLCRQFPAQEISAMQWQLLGRGRKTPIDSPLIGKVRLYLDQQFCGLGEIDAGYLKAFRLMHTGC